MPKKIVWLEQARAELRAIDRETALRLLQGLAHFTFTESGDIKRLQGYDPPQFRLRLGDYRIRFRVSNDAIEILSVRNRKDAYR